MTDKLAANILIVDDTVENLRLLAGALSSQNYRVRASPNGVHALESAAQEVPDLVLLDINMPGMSGFEVCDAFKANEALKDVPILFISALEEMDAKLEAFARGGLDYITKPFQLEEVFARVATHLELHSLRQALVDKNAQLAKKVSEEKALIEALENESRGRIEAQQYTMEQLGRVAALSEFSDRLSKHFNESGVLEACSKVASRVTGAELVELLLIDGRHTRFRRVLIHNKLGASESSWAGPTQMPWAQLILDQGEQVAQDMVEDFPVWAEHLSDDGYCSSMAVPILAGATPVGVLLAATRYTDHFDRPTRNVVRQFSAGIGAALGLVRAHKDTQDVLGSVLPEKVSERLKGGEERIAESVDLAGVFFCDLVGFTAYASEQDAVQVVSMLEEVFGVLEQLCAEYRVEKIKTIGDALMVASGVSEVSGVAEASGVFDVDDGSRSIERLADFACASGRALERYFQTVAFDLSFRIGIHAGPVIAGVVGKERRAFDIWGDTVNMASRLESTGKPGEVRCSDAVRQVLGERWLFRDCGSIVMKGKGEQQVYALLGRADNAS